MDTRLKDRIAVVTGASSGIGKVLAAKFANSGARVVLADLKSTGVEAELTAKHGEKSAIFIECTFGITFLKDIRVSPRRAGLIEIYNP